MNDVVKDLIWKLNQHQGKQDFLTLLKPPPVPRFRKGMTLEEYGALAANTSGRLEQYEMLLGLLGDPAQEGVENERS